MNDLSIGSVEVGHLMLMSYRFRTRRVVERLLLLQQAVRVPEGCLKIKKLPLIHARVACVSPQQKKQGCTSKY